MVAETGTMARNSSLHDTRIRPLALARWLLSVAVLVVLIVAVGGITRLTESGLSITEWKPVTGALPPLSAEQWEAEFKKTANALGGGSGWAMLVYNLHTGEVHNYWAWDHMHNAPAGRPLLVLDMYEHSYHMDYGSAAAKYIDAFMQNVNWEEVNRRFVGARKMAALI